MKRINFNLVGILIFIALSVISGCYGHTCTSINFENPGFPHDILLSKLKPDIIEKYTVGDVIVQPNIIDYDIVMYPVRDGIVSPINIDGGSGIGKQKVFVSFFSKETNSKITIKNIMLSYDNIEIKKSGATDSGTASEWEYYEARQPFYACYFLSGSFIFPQAEKVKKAVHMSFDVEVVEKSGNITKKTIVADFVPGEEVFECEVIHIKN